MIMPRGVGESIHGRKPSLATTKLAGGGARDANLRRDERRGGARRRGLSENVIILDKIPIGRGPPDHMGTVPRGP